MKDYKQKIILIAILVFANLTILNAQEIDSLISKIDNKDVYIILTKNMSPRIIGNDAKKIVVIGKPATKNLLNILEDQKRGIAAHFILSEIWKETWEEEICCNVKYADNKEILTLNGLEIYIKDDELFASEENLKKNKIAWGKIVKV